MNSSNITKTAAVLLVCSCLFACNNNTTPAKNNLTDTAKTISSEPKKDNALFTGVKFDSKWDLSCGMPISAGLEDTAHYKGKIYGFCSAECKADFLKDPETAIKSKK